MIFPHEVNKCEAIQTTRNLLRKLNNKYITQHIQRMRCFKTQTDSSALRWNKHSIKKGKIYSRQVRTCEHRAQTRCAVSAHNLPKTAWGSTA